MHIAKLILIPLVSLGLTACQANKEEMGSLLGAIAGAAIGNKIGGSGTSEVVAIAAGTLAGAYVGREIGRSLDRADRAAMHQTTQYSLESSPSGKISSWINPDSGNWGTIKPEPAYAAADGDRCRPYVQTVTIDGRTEEVSGEACREPDGTWVITGG